MRAVLHLAHLDLQGISKIQGCSEDKYPDVPTFQSIFRRTWVILGELQRSIAAFLQGIPQLMTYQGLHQLLPAEHSMH